MSLDAAAWAAVALSLRVALVATLLGLPARCSHVGN